MKLTNRRKKCFEIKYNKILLEMAKILKNFQILVNFEARKSKKTKMYTYILARTLCDLFFYLMHSFFGICKKQIKTPNYKRIKFMKNSFHILEYCNSSLTCEYPVFNIIYQQKCVQFTCSRLQYSLIIIIFKK